MTHSTEQRQSKSITIASLAVATTLLTPIAGNALTAPSSVRDVTTVECNTRTSSKSLTAFAWEDAFSSEEDRSLCGKIRWESWKHGTKSADGDDPFEINWFDDNLMEPYALAPDAALKMNACLEQIASFPKMKNDWNDEGSEAPNQTACDNAEKALLELAQMGSVPHRVAPSAEGGVAFSWREGSKDAFIEFYNDGEILALMSDRHKKFRDTGMVKKGEVQSALWQIINFIDA